MSTASLITSPLNLLTGLLAGHARRATAAKNENQAVQYALQDFDQSIRAIAAAFNAGQLDATTAIADLNQIANQFATDIKPYQMSSTPANFRQPTADNPNSCWTGPNCTGSKTCTAGCCVSYNVVFPACANAAYVIQNGGGTSQVCEVVGNKYGITGRAGYSLTWNSPTGGTNAVSGVASAVSKVLGLSGPNVAATGTGVALPIIAGAGLLLLALAFARGAK